MTDQSSFPDEVQLARHKALRVTSKTAIADLEARWSESLLTLIAGSQKRDIEFCGDYRVLLYRLRASTTPWPILDRHMGRTGKIIDLANGVSVESEEGFRYLLGLENRGDLHDDLRREEALTLSAAIHGYISFRPENPLPTDCEKSKTPGHPSEQVVRYVLGRATKTYEDVLTISESCEKPELQARVNLDQIEIPTDLIREPKEVQALADEIAAHGALINPITVIWTSRGRFRLIAGRRRYAAYRLLGWSTIPVRIIAGDEAHLISTQIIENDARLDMDPFTRADAYVTLKRALEDKAGQCSNKDLAEALGVTPQKVSEVLKLQQLPETLREHVRELGLGHRATVDLVRDLIKAKNPEDVLKQASAEAPSATKRPTEDSDGKVTTGKVRRKAFKFKEDGYELVIKSPTDETPSNETLIQKLEALIEKLRTGGVG